MTTPAKPEQKRPIRPAPSSSRTTTSLTASGPRRAWLPPAGGDQHAGHPFPPALADRLAAALACHNGVAVAVLLVTDLHSPFWPLWHHHNRELHGDLVNAAVATPLRTLERMVSAGEVESLDELPVRVKQVLAVSGRKHRCQSFRRLNPTDRHGLRRWVSGTELAADSAGLAPTPEQVAMAAEIPPLVQEATADLDPLQVGVYWCVQFHRLNVGKGGAYRFAARLLHFEAGQPVQFRAAADIDLGVGVRKAEVEAVRRVYLSVREVLAERLAAAGYDVPHDRKRRRRRK